ncbi:MAG: BamA/TamA family outer membrane protein [Candidatus Hydrogenedentota bacterium]
MLALRYRDLEIRDIPTFSSRQLRRERGGRTTISAVWNINRDTRDDHRNPSEGARHNFEVELAGLGGDNDFVRLEHDSTWYYSFGDRDQYVLSYRTREGYVKNYGQSDFVPLSDRFFAGGTTTIRGYRNHEVGPTERRFFIFGPVDRVGGQVRLLNNVEVQYNIFEPLRLYSFVDGGAVWAVPSDIEVDDLRFSGGVGVGFDAPMLGPVRLDYAHPINPGRYQSSSGRFHFQTGMGF